MQRRSYESKVFKTEADGKGIDEVLTCSGCTKVYSIFDTIPRLLPGALQRNLLIYHRIVFEKYQIKPEVNLELLNSRDIALRGRTLRSVSFQWNTFGEIYREYREHWQDFLPTSLRADYFKGKLGLDAGCGFGRHIRMAAEARAEMAGIEPSEAVRAANYCKYPARVLHADLFDVVPVPSTRYYDLDELKGWFLKQKLKSFEKKRGFWVDIARRKMNCGL